MGGDREIDILSLRAKMAYPYRCQIEASKRKKKPPRRSATWRAGPRLLIMSLTVFQAKRSWRSRYRTLGATPGRSPGGGGARSRSRSPNAEQYPPQQQMPTHSRRIAMPAGCGMYSANKSSPGLLRWLRGPVPANTGMVGWIGAGARG